MKHQIAPFQLSILPGAAAGSYRVRAIFGGDETHADVELTGAVRAMAGRLANTGVAEAGDAALLGRALGRALFPPPVRDLLLRGVKSAPAGSRIQLRLDAAPELAALPWELATVGLATPWSPALRDDYALVRESRAGRSGIRPLAPARVAGPLCVLAVGAPGEERQLQALEAALAGAVRAGRVALRVVPGASAAVLERALMQGEAHILHVAAPIVTDGRGRPRLLLRRADGRPGGLGALDLADLLDLAAGLRLVTLAGTEGDDQALRAAPSLLAAGLPGEGAPATIAFGAVLPAEPVARFAAACYGLLAEGAAADLATTAGRRALAGNTARSRSAARSEWGMPQLYLAPGGERLFAFAERPRAVRVRPTRLARRVLLAVGSIALAGAVLLGARALGPRPQPTTTVQPLATAGVALATPATEADPPSGFLAALLGPTATPAATATPAPIAPPASYVTYLTVADDTLAAIAGRMGSDAGAIAQLNRLDPNAPLRADRPLVIPVYGPGEAGAGGLVIDRGNPAEREVALTFDIEIDDTTLYAILDILRARGLHGTFFVTGHWVASYPDAARAIVSEGHEIANHSLTHPYFTRIGLDGAASELRETERIALETTGATTRPYFRFPYGDYNATVAGVIAGEGYVAYHWSADDGAISSWLDRVAQNPDGGNGGILLMHGRQSTVDALPGWLDRLEALGFLPTTLGDTLR